VEFVAFAFAAMTASVSPTERTRTSRAAVTSSTSPIVACERFFMMLSARHAATCIEPSLVSAFGRFADMPDIAVALTFFVPALLAMFEAVCVFLSAILSACPSSNSERMSSPLGSSG